MKLVSVIHRNASAVYTYDLWRAVDRCKSLSPGCLILATFWSHGISDIVL